MEDGERRRSPFRAGDGDGEAVGRKRQHGLTWFVAPQAVAGDTAASRLGAVDGGGMPLPVERQGFRVGFHLGAGAAPVPSSTRSGSSPTALPRSATRTGLRRRRPGEW